MAIELNANKYIAKNLYNAVSNPWLFLLKNRMIIIVIINTSKQTISKPQQIFRDGN